VDLIALVLHPEDMWRAPGYEGHANVVVAEGGATRDASVRAGLEALVPFAPDLVLIHDVARPCVTHNLIGHVVEALAEARPPPPRSP
jgi:2-C-methyl-D-erythritol 4-phosphate cytidylyltransferase / 2-C-methyl-D-erythritol 2,4-cyclodiphosphate synthase